MDPTTTFILNSQPNYRNPSVCSSHHPHTDPTILPTALNKILTAVALLHRAGPTYRHRGEAFWIFAAGCLTSRAEYEREVKERRRELVKTVSVEEDLREARRLMNEAVELLRRFEVEDVRDLEEAIGGFEEGEISVNTEESAW